MIKVVFVGSSGKERVIGLVRSKEEGYSVINKFLEEKNFKSYYSRTWEVEEEGHKRLYIDVGSWTEKFYMEFDKTKEEIQEFKSKKRMPIKDTLLNLSPKEKWELAEYIMNYIDDYCLFCKYNDSCPGGVIPGPTGYPIYPSCDSGYDTCFSEEVFDEYIENNTDEVYKYYINILKEKNELNKCPFD